MENLRTETTTAWITLMTASRTLLETVEAALKSKELPSLSWYDALLEIEGAGPNGIRPFALKSRLLLPQYGTSRLLDRIVTAGLIERIPCESDKRGYAVRITTKGREVRRAMWPVYRDVLRLSFEDRLTKDDVETLARILRKVDVARRKEN